MWCRSKCGLLLFESTCWNIGCIDCFSPQALLARPQSSCCALPVGPFLLHLFLIQVLHDFPLSRFQRGGNSRLNVNKISFPLARHSQLLLPCSAVNLLVTLCCAELQRVGAGKREMSKLDSVMGSGGFRMS